MSETPEPVQAASGLARGRTALARGRAALAGFLPRGALVLSVLTFAGYAMGLVRDRAFARTFGAGGDLDAYNAAFVLPELALDVLVAGGLVAPFVPLFTGLRAEAADDARAFGRTILTYAVLVMAIASGLLFIFAPQTVAFIVPGFQSAQRDLYVSLFRLMCVTPIIFAASIVLGEVLVAERRFVWFGLAPLFYNGGIVLGTVLLAGRYGIHAAAIGALLGALAHLGIRLLGISRTSFRPVPRFALRTKGLGEFVRLMIPKMVSHPIEPLTFLFFTALATTLEPGSVSSVSFARNFASVPVSLIGASFAIAALPILSAQFVRGDRGGFTRTLGTNLASIAIITTVGAIVLFLVSDLAIRLLLGGGAFDEVAVARTAGILAVFAFGVPLESITHLLSRGLYATHNTLLPSIASIAGFVTTVVVAEALAPTAGLAAIPTSFAAGMALKVGLLAIALAPRIARIGRTAGPADGRARRFPGRTAGPGRRLGGACRPRRGHALRDEPGALGRRDADRRARGDPVGACQCPQPHPERQPSASPGPSTPGAVGTATPGPTPSPTPTPGPYAMDLYQANDFVGEFEDTWCVAAAVQTSMNIMDTGADRTRRTQARLVALIKSLSAARDGGAEPEGWAAALTELGYGNYEVRAEPSIKAAIHLAARQIRLTNRPVGLVVWRGVHSWVMSGFTATADPAVTDTFDVTDVRIEDVWYPRFSTIWGYSRRPDARVPVARLPEDYLPWDLRRDYPDKDGQFVLVVPVP